GIGNVVESLDHLGLELGLDRRKRERVLHVVVVEIRFARRGFAALAVLLVAALGRPFERGHPRGPSRRRRRCPNTHPPRAAGGADVAATRGRGGGATPPPP